ncbi:lipopolysaccharide kinase InaA family protein [Sulfurovum sp.]|uniref:lipopolysaccharide kinase InaA family protein n=1 Tax=Sulfurovum sp. TaxID=1969726 RepID=UPI0035688078
MIGRKQIKGFLSDRLNADLRSILVRDPLLLFNNSVIDFKLEKRGRVSLVELQGHQYIVKHYYVKSWLFWFRRAFLSSLALKVQSQVAILQQNDFSTPLLLAAVDNGRGLDYQGTTCVYEYVKPDKDLGQLQDDFADFTKRAIILNSIIPLLARMHKSGIYHGDAKISNFLWVEHSSKVDISIIDLNDCRLMAKISNKQRIYDLTTLIFSLAWWRNDSNFVFECLNIYLQLDSSWCHDKEAVLDDITERVVKKLAHRRNRQER